jgi:hypothetical protein|tara:strand:+ start:668 stop:1327 length:660 start_codon:yes stop_codon:yes gene_type:complete
MKSKKVKFNKTEANVISNKIIRNAKNINQSEANTSSLIMVDIVALASYCSTYDFSERGHTSYIKDEVTKNKKLYGTESETKSKVKRLFELANSPVMRAIYGINQSEAQIRKTLKALKLETQQDIINYKKLYSVDSLGNLIENPKAKASKDSEAKASKDSKAKDSDANVSDNVYLDRVFNDIKDKIVDTEALNIHIHKLVSLTRELKASGEADTKAELQG